ncbi:MAG: hypothetical protein LUG12_05655 [Erysipelotrichaceae bacterium]|nr:hypothetical protein [Erysipelotrichaceae bacterium]
MKKILFLYNYIKCFIGNKLVIFFHNTFINSYTDYYTNTIKWPNEGQRLTRVEYQEFREKASELGYKISGFKKFDGDINLVIDCLKKTQIIREKYPDIFRGRKQIILKCSKPGFPLDNDTFAMIGNSNHEITINQYAFRSRERLSEEYSKLANSHFFVTNTNYYSIIIHELGHIIAHKYNIDCLDIANNITGLKSEETLIFIRNNLSFYAGHFNDGREIISEVFSDYFNNANPTEFSLKFIKELDKIVIKKE